MSRSAGRRFPRATAVLLRRRRRCRREGRGHGSLSPLGARSHDRAEQVIRMPQVLQIHEFNGGALIPGAPIGFLTASSVTALYRAWGRPWEAAFIVSSYANILLLLWCLRELENVGLDNLQKRRRLKVAILCLAIILNVSFCHQVAKMMPPIVSALLWSMVVLVGIGGLRLFFPTANPWNGVRRWWIDVRSSFFG